MKTKMIMNAVWLYIEMTGNQDLTMPVSYIIERTVDNVKMVYMDGAFQSPYLSNGCYLRKRNIKSIKDISEEYPFANKEEEKNWIKDVKKIFGKKFIAKKY